MSLFNELKRRNVFKVVAAYIIVAWLLLQVSDTLVPALHLPEWFHSGVAFILILGFPVAIIFAWAYEMTPDGIRKEKDVDRSQSSTHKTGRKLDFLIIGVLVVALGYFSYDKFVLDPSRDAALVEASTQAVTEQEELTVSDKTIAVLPFVNMSDDPGNEYFSDGISEEILNLLAKVSGLRVTSRSSAFSFKGQNLDVPTMAVKLNVAHVLEGSVRKSGNQLRITAQLIEVVTDTHLWSETYDRELTIENLFAIQSEISREIVGALQLVLTDEENEGLKVMPTISLEAHKEFVLGHREMAKRTAEELVRAQAHFEKAIEYDPNYALAYVGLADSLMLQVGYADLQLADSLAPRQAAIDRALALDPFLGEAYASWGFLKREEFKDEEAVEYFLKGIELSPNYATAHHWYSIQLSGSGRFEDALSHLRKAIELDPMAPVLTQNLGQVLWNLGRAEESHAILLEGIERDPEFPGFYQTMGSKLWRLGRVGEAMNWMRAAARLGPSTFEIRITECRLYSSLGAYQSAERCLESAEEAFPERAFGRRLFLYLQRGQSREAAKLMEQLEQRELTPSDKDRLGLSYFLSGEMDKARSIWQDLWPELYGDEDLIIKPNEIVKNSREIPKIVFVAYTLYVDGQPDRANYLFDRALEMMQSMHRTRGPGYGEMDVVVHAARGEKQKAISALREAIDMGWREGWWVLRLPIYDSMREEPEWIALLVELEADIARQRQWYEDHKDDPLF